MENQMAQHPWVGRIPHGLEVNDRGRSGRECPVCGDLFYREARAVTPGVSHDRYVRHWRAEHTDPRRPPRR
jgi:hypothetical protein